MDFEKNCCFCGCAVKGIGHNPKPVENREGAVCCDWCDSTVVIPARILLFIEEERKAEL
uniref:hypothetical protein n=1 Tax=Acetatifactor sp. TaxID=1872090 RepID=UPI004055F71B